jgi:RES domain-containing protein
MAETLAHARYHRLPVYSVMPRTFVALSVRLHHVLDLTPDDRYRSLRVSKRSLLRTDWRREMDQGRCPVTQAIGWASYEAGLEAILVPSAADVRGQNLVVFPAALVPQSHIDVIHADRL